MSSLSNFGLTATGLSVPRQADFAADLKLAFAQTFGANINLDDRSNMAQLINIMSERFAFLTELLEAIYQASYPAGAEGVAVDNILALQGLVRLAASPARTAQAPVTDARAITTYGFVCYGDPGTVVPAGSLVADNAQPQNTFSVDANITIGKAQNCSQTLVLSTAPQSGSFALTLTAPSGEQITTPAIPYNAAGRTVALSWGNNSFLTSPAVTLQLGTLGTVTVPSSQGLTTGQAIAQQINSQLGLSTVTASGDINQGVTLDFGAMSVPPITSGGDFALQSVTPGIQGIVNALAGASGDLPFTDVAVTRNGTVLTFQFGAFAPVGSQPSTAQTPIPILQVAANNLLAGAQVVNITPAVAVAGQPAQGVGSATCTATGPIAVAAGQLENIQTPVAGWSACTNQLDCVAGTDAESDTEALARRQSLTAGQASGPLAAILQRVLQVSGVTVALGVTNTTLAAQQVVVVGAGATTGSFALLLGGATTAPIAYNAAPGDVQTALRALPGCELAVVSGSAFAGFVVDFAGSNGGQPQPQILVTNNTTGGVITVSWGRYPKSVEVVVAGGADTDVAQAIFEAAPAGLALYGSPVATTSLQITAGSPVVTAASATGLVAGLGVDCLGVPQGAQIVSINGSQLTLSTAATASGSGLVAKFGHFVAVTDAAGNVQIVRFSRPVQVPIYVAVTLTTNPAFNVASVPQIQADIVAAISAVGVGGTLIATGTGGIANSFRDVAGIDAASVAFDVVNPPVNTAKLVLQPEQAPSIQLQNVSVTLQ